GVLDGAAAQAAEAEPAPGFESRLGEELARAKRAHLETGLIVIDLAPGAPRRETRGRATVPNPVARQLRASDVLGRLKGGEICVLLAGTNAEGTEYAASRLYQSLETLARQHDLPGVTVGATTFNLADDSVTDVLARAEHDARRRTGGRE
ncbi:MAG: diguanylate cyclase, partial [Acidobacteria bacterium]